MVGKWLLTNPEILILDEPTRGIDVGAKAEIHNVISQLAREGVAVIVVSSELPEIQSISDRVMVVYQGKIVHECKTADSEELTLVSHAFGQNEVKMERKA